MANILDSPTRIAALKDYLVTLSKAFCPRDLETRVDTTKPGDENEGLGKIIDGKVQQPPQPAFKRIHLLYLLHDVMMHTQAHVDSRVSKRKGGGQAQSFAQLRPMAATLARLAVCGSGDSDTGTQSIVLDIAATWKSRQLFTVTECDDISQLVKESSSLRWDEVVSALAAEDAQARSKGTIEEGFDWIVPNRHSNLDDQTAPWHELPAANGLYMKRTRGFPLRAVAFPNGGYEIEGAGCAADAELKQEVTALFEDMVRCSEKHTNPDDVQDVDALGNVIWKDADRPTRNYWGWTLEGIDMRRELATRFAAEAKGYADLPATRPAGVNSAVERAKALAAGQNGGGPGPDPGPGFSMGGGGIAGGRGSGFDVGRGGFRGGGRGYRGADRGDFRGGYRGRHGW